MFKQYNFENNVKNKCSLKVATLMLILSFFSFIIRIKNLITHLFQNLIYEYKIICIINNSHVNVNYVAQ